MGHTYTVIFLIFLKIAKAQYGANVINSWHVAYERLCRELRPVVRDDCVREHV